MTPIGLAAGDYEVLVSPDDGGVIDGFTWQGRQLMRSRCGPGPLNSACFPLAPFSNRIADGRFAAGGRIIQLAANAPEISNKHPLHGFGWREPWRVVDVDTSFLRLRVTHAAGAWPWAFESEQLFTVTPGGFRHEIRLLNNSDEPMPAGIGFHPYFPRTQLTRYSGLHRGEWAVDADGLPAVETPAGRAVDWWEGRPVSTRVVDTVYSGREGDLLIVWPERNLELRIRPDPVLAFTNVYTPDGADFFCVEPVSHVTNAVNFPEGAAGTGLRWLSPAESMGGQVFYEAAHSKAAGSL